MCDNVRVCDNVRGCVGVIMSVCVRCDNVRVFMCV